MSKKRGRRTAAPAKVSYDYHAKDKWFTFAKVLLTVSPLLSLGYFQATSIRVGADIQTILQDNPALTVSFLASMIGPFIAYLMKFMQEHLYQGDAAYTVINLTVMMIAEAMISNLFYFIMMIVLLYFVFDMTGISPIKAFRQKWGNHFWRDISGSIVVLAVSAFCMFVSMRLGI